MVAITTGNVGTMQMGDVFEGTKSTAVSTESNQTTTNVTAIPFGELEQLLPNHKETIEKAKQASEKGDTEVVIDAVTDLIQAGGRVVTKWIVGKGLI
jgi:hypothetical protein